MFAARNRRAEVLFLSILLAFGCCSCDLPCEGEEDVVLCPEVCECSFLNDNTRCSDQELTALPLHINSQVKILDLSNNLFTEIPSGLSMLESITQLYLQNNKISHLDEFSLNLSSLVILDLSNNDITSWKNIHPRVLNLTSSLKELCLADNRLRDISNMSALSSTSLETLDLRNCSLNTLPANFLTNLTNLKSLTITENRLYTMPSLISDSLVTLNLTKSNVQRILPNVLSGLTTLISLFLSRNRIQVFHPLASDSLELLDISFCNLEEVSLSLLTNLKTANLKENRLNKIAKRHISNKKLQYLDLSRNSIKRVETNAFSDLSLIIRIDLSMNLLNSIDENAFSHNNNLTILNLSRNYLTSIKFNILSLQMLDMSNCEIQYIYEDSLVGMPALNQLYLSRNLIKNLPRKIEAKSLEYLDFSLNRLSDVQNETFIHMTNLIKLDLRGNRFTVGLKKSNFPDNLREILLDDNLWRCECFSADFFQFYEYITKSPVKVTDSYRLICHSPENVTGLPWKLACSYAWYDPNQPIPKQKIWLFAISMIIALVVIFCSIMSIRRIYALKRLRQQRERQIQAAEAQERIRRMRSQQRREDAQQNAPDPRELQRPPSYAEAVLMPRIDGSYASLAGSRPNITESNPDVSRRNRERALANKQTTSQSASGSRSDLEQGRPKRNANGNTDNAEASRLVTEPTTSVEPTAASTEPVAVEQNQNETTFLPRYTIIESNF